METSVLQCFVKLLKKQHINLQLDLCTSVIDSIIYYGGILGLSME